MRRPLDIATRHSVDFIHAHARANGDVLEIGCGDGDVAQQLQNAGHSVTAIDGDAAAVAAARAKGVNAVQAHWPNFQSGKTDAIAFTRSLHHMHDLTGAVASAQARLRAGGILLVEDFAFNEADERTNAWFAAQLKSEPVASLLAPPPNSFVAKLLSAEKPHDAWRSDHGHDLHAIEAMAAAVDSAFNAYVVSPTPYLYRYLIQALPETAEAADIVGAFFKAEEHMIASRDIVPIGRRIVASIHDGD